MARVIPFDSSHSRSKTPVDVDDIPLDVAEILRSVGADARELAGGDGDSTFVERMRRLEALSPTCADVLAGIADDWLDELGSDKASRSARQAREDTGFSLQVLSSGPKRTFWRSLCGAGTFDKAIVDTLDDAIARARSLLATRAPDLLEPEQLMVETPLMGKGLPQWHDCFVRRGRFRVEIFVLPDHLRAEFVRRAAEKGRTE